MKILVSNDDGYLAEGLSALAHAMSSIGDVVVVAPERNCSGASNALTLGSPLRVTEVKKNTYFINGTPSDCVHIALTGLLGFVPDLMVSGINQGQNMGDDTLYSGTVAAATEAFLFGIPSIAFSQVNKGWAYLEDAAKCAQHIVQNNRDVLPSPYLLNVNIPNCAYEELKGIKATRLGKRHQSETVIQMLDPENKLMYWIGPAGAAKDAGPGTDFDAVNQGYVSVTPLQIDLTHKDQLSVLKKVW